MLKKKHLLINPDILIRQQRAKWTARLATVRLSSRAPWEEERRIIGMVASPVENLNIVMLKLDADVQMSDFARPLCLAPPGGVAGRCVALGWDALGGELRTAALAPADMAECEEESEVGANTVCMTRATEGEECAGEMMAGHGLMCQHQTEETEEAEGAWHLVGVAAWRRGCGSVGQRPRLYEIVNTTSAWVESVIRLDTGTTSPQPPQVPRRRLG